MEVLGSEFPCSIKIQEFLMRRKKEKREFVTCREVLFLKPLYMESDKAVVE